MSSQPELRYKRELVDRLWLRRWHVQEHEDRQGLFIPDLSIARNGVDIWIEVKYRDKLPPTLHSMKHWTAGQEKWLVERGQAGCGLCFLLLGVPGHHYLWKWSVLRTVRRMSIDRAIEYCHADCAGDVDNLVCWLGNQYRRPVVPGA